MSRTERKKYEREQKRMERKENVKRSIKDRVEEFKLNRQGKTKRKRTEVMGRYRRTERILTALIAIVLLLLIITWIVILFYYAYNTRIEQLNSGILVSMEEEIKQII